MNDGIHDVVTGDLVTDLESPERSNPLGDFARDVLAQKNAEAAHTAVNPDPVDIVVSPPIGGEMLSVGEEDPEPGNRRNMTSEGAESGGSSGTIQFQLYQKTEGASVGVAMRAGYLLAEAIEEVVSTTSGTNYFVAHVTINTTSGAQESASVSVESSVEDDDEENGDYYREIGHYTISNGTVTDMTQFCYGPIEGVTFGGTTVTWEMFML